MHGEVFHFRLKWTQVAVGRSVRVGRGRRSYLVNSEEGNTHKTPPAVAHFPPSLSELTTAVKA